MKNLLLLSNNNNNNQKTYMIDDCHNDLHEDFNYCQFICMKQQQQQESITLIASVAAIATATANGSNIWFVDHS